MGGAGSKVQSVVSLLLVVTPGGRLLGQLPPVGRQPGLQGSQYSHRTVFSSYLGSGGEQFVGKSQLLLQLQLNLHIVLHLKCSRMQDIVFTGEVLFSFRFSAG